MILNSTQSNRKTGLLKVKGNRNDVPRYFTEAEPNGNLSESACVVSKLRNRCFFYRCTDTPASEMDMVSDDALSYTPTVRCYMDARIEKYQNNNGCWKRVEKNRGRVPLVNHNPFDPSHCKVITERREQYRCVGVPAKPKVDA